MAAKRKVVYRSRPKKRARRRNRFTLPAAIMIPMAQLGIGLVSNTQKMGIKDATAVLGRQLTGYDARDHKFHMDGLRAGLFPLMMGWGVHKIATVTGLNRALGRAGVPWVRI